MAITANPPAENTDPWYAARNTFDTQVKSTANGAETAAAAATTAAATADGKAVAADGKAVAADGKASTALTNAATADGKAVAAQTTANTAKAAADLAPIAVQWITGTGWGSYSTDPLRVRVFLSQPDDAATAPTYYNGRDFWLAHPEAP